MKKIKNIDSVAHVWGGVGLDPDAEYTIQDKSESITFSKDNQFLADIANGKAQFSVDNIPNTSISSIIGLLNGEVVQVSSIPPFAAKTVDGKKLYKRVVGIREAVIVGETVINWSQIFPWGKFMEIQFTNVELGDHASLEVYDDANGTYSTVPNYKLNQFGFTVNMGDKFYSHKSEFDADLYFGMVIRISYHSISAKTVGINFIMNEVK